jgi:hypothetical protein
MGWHWPIHFGDGNTGSAGPGVVEIHCFGESQDRDLVEVSESENLAAYRALDAAMCLDYLLLVVVSSMVSLGSFDIRDC